MSDLERGGIGRAGQQFGPRKVDSVLAVYASNSSRTGSARLLAGLPQLRQSGLKTPISFDSNHLCVLHLEAKCPA
jgi:hypothetical protein